MNIVTKIRLLLAINKAYEEVSHVKSGWKTTEFWVTVFTASSGLLGTYGGMIPPPWGIIATTVVAAGYTISRAFVKSAAAGNGNGTSTPTTALAPKVP